MAIDTQNSMHHTENDNRALWTIVAIIVLAVAAYAAYMTYAHSNNAATTADRANAGITAPATPNSSNP